MKQSTRERLDRVLLGIEEATLSAADTEFQTAKDLVAAKTVREIIGESLARQPLSGDPFIPSSASERRVLLEIIARSPAGLPREIRKVYGSGQKMSDSKVSELLRHLLLRSPSAKRPKG